MFVGKVPGQQAAQMQANYGELSLQLRTAKSPHGDGFAEVRIRTACRERRDDVPRPA